MSGNAAPRQNNWPEIGGHDIWKVTKIKVKKFGPHLVAPKITEELRKQKSNRNGWISFCKRFQICSFMSQKKSFQVITYTCIYLLEFIVGSSGFRLRKSCRNAFQKITGLIPKLACMLLKLLKSSCGALRIFAKKTTI